MTMPNPFRTGDLNTKKQTSAFKYVEKAIPLVTFNQNKKCKSIFTFPVFNVIIAAFVVNPEAI